MQPSTVGAESGIASTGQLTNEERWNLVWACIAVYYLYDAAVGFVIAILCFAGGMVAKLAFGSTCESSTWIVSIVVLVFRALDTGCGCCGVLRDPVPNRRAFFWDIIRNIMLCIVLGILGLTMLIMSALLFGSDDCLISAILGVVSGLLLIVQSGEEFVIWIAVMVVYCISGSPAAQLPNWFDNCIPTFVKEKAMKHRAAAGRA
eukprot:TRINITY_DN83488_c0_g1_i1.p1 TRINITY_DN83488_c0_g1~~TRINITY_DN83488_c0_g1_i1.p1  ORF type:complete len:204 (+),score=28.86 TRINITY_DN83488_c0_g1_i1:33-644(+)